MDDEQVRIAVGRALAAMRNERGLTQSQVASALGVTQAAISYWEKGRRTPNVSDVTNYAAAIGTTPANVMLAAEQNLGDDFAARAKRLAAEINSRPRGRKRST